VVPSQLEIADVFETVLEQRTLNRRVRRVEVDVILLEEFVLGLNHAEKVMGVGQKSVDNLVNMGRQLIPLDELRVERVVNKHFAVRGAVREVRPVEPVRSVVRVDASLNHRFGGVIPVAKVDIKSVKVETISQIGQYLEVAFLRVDPLRHYN